MIICSKVVDSDGDEMASSERCIPGYMNCFTRDDYDNYFTAPRDASILDNLSDEGFIAKYRDYRFRAGRVEYPADMRCFDNMVFFIDIQGPDGTITEKYYSWNKTVEFDGYQLGLSRIKTVNGSFYPIDWIRRTN